MCKIYKPVINVAATAAKIKAYRIRAGYSVREIQNEMFHEQCDDVRIPPVLH